MSFAIGIITVGVVAILVGFLPERFGKAVRGAGNTPAQLAVGVVLIVVGVVLLVTS